MTNQGKIGLLLGTVIGAAIAYLLKFRLAGDEERPPIIVRGGSLKFQSGDEESKKQTEKEGKPWLEEQNRPCHWKSDHREGKAVVAFSVRFVGATNFEKCPALSVTEEVTVYYSTARGDESKYVIKLEPDSEGDLVPVIIGSNLEPKDQKKQNPCLVYDQAGKGSVRVEFKVPSGTVNCSTPGKVKIKPLHE